MSDYRLEGCSACGAVKLALRTAITEQRERDHLDRCENVGGLTPVWVVDFCDKCQREYEASLGAPSTERSER